MSIYEIIMLICFGAAWPFSIYKSLKSKSTKGKSSLFMIVLIIGYVFGILNKLLVKYDYVIYLYIINAVMVGIDLILFYKNRALEKKY
ncbi:hypothetical protein F6X86_13900 [Enterococcus durans]|uniref:PQ loop repeat n=1 Tax=Enterococcus durans TaxID=53345 RepID=A0A5N0YLK7_9ENTE|nr:hypothetical protein F6X86_13900 [Enterococcus durans]KAA9182379.1 hypothetical protein F6X85_13650 [Enterococcus durans]KAA9183345.1 hypothetical protein F6X90_14025 [Enterococcus durans]KAA9187594.1 hypothetical protein F6Y12_14095 [Enterococcus durans]KAA9190023.1 hypothetical protein F6X88_13995 [Enterococcus durans]